MGFKIENLWAFVSVDEDGDEGLAAFMSDDVWMPMVAADEKRVESLRAIAQKLAESSDGKVALLRFAIREDIEVFEP
jgi:hypothetical protein